MRKPAYLEDEHIKFLNSLGANPFVSFIEFKKKFTELDAMQARKIVSWWIQQKDGE